MRLARWVAIAVAMLLLAGCWKSPGTRRVRVIAVNLVSADGKGWVHTGPVYSVGTLTRDGEQDWFISVHKLEVGRDVCINWVPGSGWATTPCPEELQHEVYISTSTTIFTSGIWTVVEK